MESLRIYYQKWVRPLFSPVGILGTIFLFFSYLWRIVAFLGDVQFIRDNKIIMLAFLHGFWGTVATTLTGVVLIVIAIRRASASSQPDTPDAPTVTAEDLERARLEGIWEGMARQKIENARLLSRTRPKGLGRIRGSLEPPIVVSEKQIVGKVQYNIFNVDKGREELIAIRDKLTIYYGQGSKLFREGKDQMTKYTLEDWTEKMERWFEGVTVYLRNNLSPAAAATFNDKETVWKLPINKEFGEEHDENLRQLNESLANLMKILYGLRAKDNDTEGSQTQ